MHASSKTGRTERYDSFFELLRMRVLDLDPDVVDWTKVHEIVIEYQHDGRTRRYVPDFRVVRESGVMLEEIKGYEDETKLAAKLRALTDHCARQGWQHEYFDAAAMDDMARKWFGEPLTALRRKAVQC